MTTIKLKQFSRTCHDVRIGLQPLNVIVGEPESGMDSILTAIDCLRNAALEFFKGLPTGGGLYAQQAVAGEPSGIWLRAFTENGITKQYAEGGFSNNIGWRERYLQRWARANVYRPMSGWITQTSGHGDYLEPDYSNLDVVISHIHKGYYSESFTRKAFYTYAGITDLVIGEQHPTGSCVYLVSGSEMVALSELSSCGLNYIRLLTAMYAPHVGVLMGFEYPESALHPDLMSEVIQSVMDIRGRTTVVCTTNSEDFLDALTEDAGSVLVARSGESGMEVERLTVDKVMPHKTPLGKMWRQGHIGGNRW